MLNTSSDQWQLNHPASVIPIIIKSKTYHGPYEKYNSPFKCSSFEQKRTLNLNCLSWRKERSSASKHMYFSGNKFHISSPNKIEWSIIDSKTTNNQHIRLSKLFKLKHNPKISCFSPKHDPIHTHQHFNRMQMHTLNQLTRKNRLLLTYSLNFDFQQCA
jgi:hypothetical protein